MNKTLILIDGSGFIYRAFYALPPLSHKGTQIGAVFGFCNMILRLRETKKPTHWAVVFDSPVPTFRSSIFPMYKQNRTEKPKELISQFDIVKEACEAFKIPTLCSPKFEADDVIATYARKIVSLGYMVEIVSSDKDLMQLVDENTLIYDPIKSKTISNQEVIEKWGVAPDKIVDVQALSGDPSDNIPGVPGIGPKTATKLIQEFGSLDSLFKRIDLVSSTKKGALIRSNESLARMSKTLATLRYDTPLPNNNFIELLRYQDPTSTALSNFLQKYGFNSLNNKIFRDEQKINHANVNQKISAISIDEPYYKNDALSLVKKTQSSKLCAVSYSYHADAPYELYIYTDQGDSWHLTAQNNDCSLTLLRNLFENDSIIKVTHDAKSLIKALSKTCNIKLKSFEDIMLMSYVILGGRSNHSLEDIAERELGESKKTKIENELIFEDTRIHKIREADQILRAYHSLQIKITQGSLSSVYELLERPLVNVLVNMEMHGIKVDVSALRQIGDEFSTNISELENEIYLAAGERFNIASPKQLSNILFNRLGWHSNKKNKTGAFKTSVDILEEFANKGFKLADKILEWRQLSKLVSTYIDALIRESDKSGRVHTTYSMAETSTGRLSSHSPNLQNIPIKTAYGKKIRNAFIAEKGNILLSIDYSQIELRLLAYIGDIKELKHAFEDGKNIHEQTAIEVFGNNSGMTMEEMTRKAKIINFGIIYGMSAFGLSKQLKVPQSEASKYIALYFEKYPGIVDYMDKMKEHARAYGFVSTIFGRKCSIPNILSNKHTLRSAAERQAINAPLQGSCADIIKRAMVDIHEEITKRSLLCNIVLQIHDELVFEVAERFADEYSENFSKIMVNAAPIPVNVKSSQNKLESIN
ncbi:DNA polymerase I [Candidatus Hydrogenosomobacter endosymbioticus]|uniref:DNA polymerase I n=1 Tax=Candidatus Hydrogenosomobacter endosymbioticus TaxID=2558174 RepID=A0ABM7V834_9PROT|nr:DNA polymerase I [Candidatus Hydrogenosomobacter endosymbioticus]BDB95931.1 DNA polymerase I [Candidatus Hydrogenosomobacter endosymbioticus]